MWLHSIAILAVLLGIGAALGALFGIAAATVWLAVTLVGVSAFHLIYLARLSHWLALPRMRDLPLGVGIWSHVLDRLARYARNERTTRIELQTELEQIHAAVDHLPDALVVLDRYQHVVWCNSAAEKLLGVFGVQLPIHHFIRQPEFIAALARPDSTEPVVLALPQKPGSMFEIRLLPVVNDQRLLIATDVTDRHRVEAIRRDFVANVSHEIRTPLTVIGGFVETMLDLPTDEAARKGYLETIHAQTSTMKQLVEDLLTLASLEHSDGRLTDEVDFDMHGLLQAAMTDARVISSGKHQFTIALDAPKVLRGNREQIQSAVRNLLTNAIRYTPTGGTIRLRWWLHDNHPSVSVIDTGIGIAAEHIPRVTERFYRVDRGRSRATGGTGLGLSIVKHVVQRHGAKLDIQSTVGQGSNFTIEFPAERLVPEIPPTPTEASSATLAR